MKSNLRKSEVIKMVFDELNIDSECRFFKNNFGDIYIIHKCECGSSSCENCNGEDSPYIVVGELKINNRIERL
jgi:hypothetical protein